LFYQVGDLFELNVKLRCRKVNTTLLYRCKQLALHFNVKTHRKNHSKENKGTNTYPNTFYMLHMFSLC